MSGFKHTSSLQDCKRWPGPSIALPCSQTTLPFVRILALLLVILGTTSTLHAASVSLDSASEAKAIRSNQENDQAPNPGLKTAQIYGVPIYIEADHFQVSMTEEKAIWRGDVRATQGNYTFHAGVLTVHLDQINTTPTESSASNSSAQGTNAENGPQVTLTAENVSYDISQDKIIAEGSSELRRGIELIKAEHITYHVSEQVAYALPNASGRVHVQFFSNPQQPVFPGIGAISAFNTPTSAQYTPTQPELASSTGAE